jgi:Ni/Co efflux regulator RcnB
MRNRFGTFVAIGTILSLALGGSALAKGHGRGHGDGDGEGSMGRGGHSDVDDGFDGPPGLAKKPYGLPPGQAKKLWRQGQQIPRSYTQSQYLIGQPQRYGLSSPPPGYEWVLVQGDAYLVQTNTDIISNIVANVVSNLIR